MSPELFAQIIVQGLMVGSVYALVSIGMTLIFLTTELMNFAHGSFLLLSMYVALSLNTAFLLDPYVSLLLTTPLFFVVGCVLFRFVIARVLKGNVLVAAQVTIGILWVIESLLATVYGFNGLHVPSVVATSKLYIGAITIGTPYAVAFVAAGVIGIALYVLIQRTHFGRCVRAVTQNREAAQLMGIRVGRTQTTVFGIGLGLLGFSGPLIAPVTMITPIAGLNFTLFSFSVMIFGGMGSLLGAVAGGLIFGVVQTLASFFSSGNSAAIIPYAALMLVLLLRPRGILGGK